ncbi:MAG: hypothetical protein ACREUN_04665, partial [Burkholderiales bacterium]
MRPTRGALAHAAAVVEGMLLFTGPADEMLSAYFRQHRALGQQERAFVAEASFAGLRRRRSLEAAAGSAVPGALVAAAVMRVLGLSSRALEGLIDDALAQRIRSFRVETLPDAARADLPDWLWQRLLEEHGRAEALGIAQGMLNPAPLDLRVNLARADREEVLARLERDGIEAAATRYSPAG